MPCVGCWLGGEAMADSLLHIPLRLFSFMPEPNKWLTNPKTAMIHRVQAWSFSE